MPPRQQRTTNVRGRLQAPNFRPVPDMMWNIASVAGNQCTINLPSSGAHIFVSGIPPIEASPNGVFPTDAQLVGGNLVLTYASALETPLVLTLSELSQAVRDANGAFLAVGTQYLPDQNPALPAERLTWTARLSGTNETTVSLGISDFINFAFNPFGFRNVSDDNAVAGMITATSGELILSWAHAEVGYQLTYTGPELLTVAPQQKMPAEITVTVTA